MAPSKQLTFTSVPQNPETFKRNLDQNRAEISTKLGILHIPWESRFFGLDPKRRLVISLNFLGEIEVTGEDQKTCKDKIQEILGGLGDVFGERIPYTDPSLVKFTIDDSIKANIESVVPKNILGVVKDALKEYSVRDVNFGFAVEKEKKEVRVFFERPSSPTDKEAVPLRIRVTAPSEDVATEIQKQLKAQLTR